MKAETNRSPKWLYAVLFVVASLPFIWNLWTERYFSADGAGYFRSLVDHGWFQDFAWSRNHAAYLSQWPIVLAVNMGVTDFGWLKFLFGLGLYVPCVASFILCLVFVDKGDEPLLLMPVFSLLTLTLAGDSIMTGEHHILVYVVSPILILLMRRRAYGLTDGAVLLLLMVAHLRLYESALATGSLFAVIVLFRMFLGTGGIGRQRWLHGLLLGMALGSIIIAAYAVIFPRDPSNKGHFLAAIFSSLGSQTFLTTAAFILPAMLGLMIRNVKLIWFGLLGFSVLALLWLMSGLQTYASISFASRALTLWYLPLIMVLTLGLKIRGRQLAKQEWLPVCIFVSLASALHLGSSHGWLQFRQLFESELDNSKGFVRVEDTKVLNDPHRWGWTSAMLSYYWSDGEVRTIIVNEENIGWEPFDPKQVRILDGVLDMNEALEAEFK